MLHIVCISAHDTSNGAGITRDCIVAHDWGIWAHPAITAITTQSFNHVLQIYPLHYTQILEQLESIFKYFTIKAVKIGMLYDENISYHIASFLKKHDVNDIILDPIIVSSGGEMLLTDKAFEIYLNHLLPLVSVLTPNKSELQRICGKKINNISDAIIAARSIAERYDVKILLKSGHFIGETLTDYVVTKNQLVEFSHPRENFYFSHGTGCVLSTSFTCCKAMGMDDASALEKSVNYTIDYFVKTSKKMNIPMY